MIDNRHVSRCKLFYRKLSVNMEKKPVLAKTFRTFKVLSARKNQEVASRWCCQTLSKFHYLSPNVHYLKYQNFDLAIIGILILRNSEMAKLVKIS